MLYKTKHNIIAVTAQLLKHWKIKVSSVNLYETLTEHPDYPSLQALSDSLIEWKVPHTAIKIRPEQYAKDMHFPFVAHLKDNQFILVQDIDEFIVHYSNEVYSNGEMPETEFLQRWDGVILYAESREDSGEINYKESVLKGWFQQASLPFLIALLFCFLFSGINHTDASWLYFILLGIKVVGVAVSVPLIMHSIDANNPLIQNLCSLGKKNNCNAILKSDVAKISSWLSWSEIGLFYFTGSLLSLIIAPSSFNLLAWLNLFALPYTFYSIYYQYRHKNWCILCCMVQALLWAEAIIFGLSQFLQINVSPLISSPKILLAFFLPVAIWFVLKSILLKASQLNPLRQQLKKFKYNSDLFNQLLATQPQYAVPNELMPITLGNPNAETVITMVSNPFCGPCGTAHRTLHKWLLERNDLQLKIIFTTANHDDDNRTNVVRHLTALSLQQDKSTIEKALNDWYDQSTKKYETWASKYPVSFNGEMSTVTEKQKQWCEMVEIAFTPTILINGYKLIDPYRLEDIKYLIN